jgi:hypothetical protein
VPIDLKLLTSAINHHAQELHRLLAVKCEYTGIASHEKALLVALFAHLGATENNNRVAAKPLARAS